MASYSMEEFLRDGVLKGLIPKLVEGGWDDVPTLKMMNSEDMDALNLIVAQKDALEIRTYLHDRSLMEYADRLEAAGKSLPELLNLSTSVLVSKFGMRRGHIVRFIDRTSACGVRMPPSSVFSSGQGTMSSFSKSSLRNDSILNSRKIQIARPSLRDSLKYEGSIIESSMADFKIDEDHVFKGIVAAEPAEPRLCCCFQPPPIVDDLAPYSSIENISVQKLTPQYKVGMEVLVSSKAPPMRASELWRDKPVVLLCIRRPGCIMCRAEAHQLYARKPIFDALGFQLIAVIHEQVESEVKELWPRYWGGVIVFDRSKEFYRALGGGQLLKEKFLTGFLFNRRAIANYKRAKATGLEHNFRGEGEIKGGLFIIGRGKSGVAYQFIERNFGDWAPTAEVVEICSRIQELEVCMSYSGIEHNMVPVGDSPEIFIVLVCALGK